MARRKTTRKTSQDRFAGQPTMFLDPASWVAAGTAAAPWLAKGIAAALKKDKVVFVRILASGKGSYEDNVTALGDRFVVLVFYNISPHAMYLEDLEISVPKNRPLTITELDRNKLPIDPARVRTYEPDRVLPITLVPGDDGRVVMLLRFPSDPKLPDMITVSYRLGRLDERPSKKDVDTLEVRVRSRGPSLVRDEADFASQA